MTKQTPWWQDDVIITAAIGTVFALLIRGCAGVAGLGHQVNWAISFIAGGALAVVLYLAVIRR